MEVDQEDVDSSMAEVRSAEDVDVAEPENLGREVINTEVRNLRSHKKRHLQRKRQHTRHTNHPTPRPTLHPTYSTNESWWSTTSSNYWSSPSSNSIPNSRPSFYHPTLVDDDSTTSFPTADHPTYFPTPQHSSYFPTPQHSTYVPTPVFSTSVPTELPSNPPSSSHVDIENWVELLDEGFDNGFGEFNSGGFDVKYYSYVKTRSGVIRIQDGNVMDSSVYSDSITLDTTYSKFKVSFSFYANSMEVNDAFCLDYSVDDSVSWYPERCWHFPEDFDNKIWYDDMELEFEAVDAIDSMSIRFRCQANSFNDDILLDSVKVHGLA